jgi:hypothetical protein
MEKFRHLKNFLYFISTLWIILTEEIKFSLSINFPSFLAPALFYSAYTPYCDAYGCLPTQ